MSDAVPPWAQESPELHPPDRSLTDRAVTERERLLALLAPWLADGVEHIGSTAVPGLDAKPIIDLMASVRDLDDVVEHVGGPLAADGWCYVPPIIDSGSSWRRFFVKPDPSGQHRVAHLHVIQAGHSRWTEQLAFRDALRRDAGLARRYADLKCGLAAAHAGDREAYSDGKASFIADALRDTAGRRCDVAALIDELERDGALLADAAEAAGLTAAVPPCPGWRVRDLVRHQAYVHAWAARHVKEQLTELIDEANEDQILGGGPPDRELVAAYRAGCAALVATLRGADPGTRCATFMPAPSPLAFWARRQAHETAIHRFDAQAARPGGPPDPVGAFDPVFADDGIDELIMGSRPEGAIACAATANGR